MSLFGNSNNQGGGNLFGRQQNVQSNQGGNPLFGSQIQNNTTVNQLQTNLSTSEPPYEILGHRGYVPNEKKDGLVVYSISATLRGRSLDELRVNDYFAFKKNRVPTEIKNAVMQNTERNMQNAAAGVLPQPNLNNNTSNFQSNLNQLGYGGSNLLGNNNLYGGNLGANNQQQTGGLFGNPTQGSNNIFGQNTNQLQGGLQQQQQQQQQSQASSLFNQLQSGVLPQTNQTQVPTVFNNASPNQGGLFGQNTPNPQNQTTGLLSGGGTGGLFGSQPQTNTSQLNPLPQQTTNQTGGGLFGNPNNLNPTTQGLGTGTTGGLFANQNQRGGGGLFGNQSGTTQPTLTNQPTGGLFANQQPQSNTNTLFPNTTNQTVPNLLSSSPVQTNPTTGGGLFSGQQSGGGGGLFNQQNQVTTPTTQQTSTGGGLFNQQSQGNTASTQQANTNTPGLLSQSQTQQGGGGLFANSKPSGGLLGQDNSQKPLFGKPSGENKPSGTSNNLFGASTTPENNQNTDVSQPKKTEEQTSVEQVPINQKPKVEKVINSGPGSFSHELNKMMFSSSLLELFKDHNMQFSAELFENSDFVSQLFSFLQSYGINPPSLALPKFKVKHSKFPLKLDQNIKSTQSTVTQVLDPSKIGSSQINENESNPSEENKKVENTQ